MRFYPDIGMLKQVVVLILSIGAFVVGSLVVEWPVEAAICRDTKDHRICILTIKRSAKHYWEYRAAVSIDGKPRPIEQYNCRDRLRTQADGTVMAFRPQGAGDVICRFFKP